MSALAVPRVTGTPARPLRATITRLRTPPVLERTELSATDLLAVAEGDALAIVIPGYMLREQCEALAAQLLAAEDLWTRYPAGTGAEHIGTLGTALYSCVGEEFSDDCQDYFDGAPARNRQLRKAVVPCIFPADRVRIELDNEWPGGAKLLRVAGRPAFFGLCRCVESGGGIEVHTDRADWDLPCPETAPFQAQLFMNIYLSQAEQGGDLELWDIEIPGKADYDALRSPIASFALDRTRLPAPTATVCVAPGTLVIANASKPHAVTACVGAGRRMSVSGFLGYCGPHEYLRVFS